METRFVRDYDLDCICQLKQLKRLTLAGLPGKYYSLACLVMLSYIIIVNPIFCLKNLWLLYKAVMYGGGGGG